MVVVYRSFVVHAVEISEGELRIYELDLSTVMRREGLAPIYRVALSPSGDLLSVVRWEEGRRDIKLNIGVFEIEVGDTYLSIVLRYKQSLAVDIRPLIDKGIRAPYRASPAEPRPALAMHPSRPLMIFTAWRYGAMLLGGYDLDSGVSTIYLVLPRPYFYGKVLSRLGLRNMAIDHERGAIYYAWMASESIMEGGGGYVDVAIFRFTPTDQGLYRVEWISTISVELDAGEDPGEIRDPGIWLSPDGGKVALLIPRYTGTGDLYIVDTASGEILAVARNISTGLISDYLVVWSPGSRYASFIGTLDMSIGSGIQPIYILDTETGGFTDLSQNFTLGPNYLVTDFLARVKQVGGGRLLYIEKGSLVLLVDLEAREIRFGDTIPIVSPGKGVDISPDGSILAMITVDSSPSRMIRVVALSTDSGEEVWSYDTGLSITGLMGMDVVDGLLAWSPGGDYLVVVVSSGMRDLDGKLYRYNFYLLDRDGNLVTSYSAWLPPADRVSLAPDGGNLVLIGGVAEYIVYGLNLGAGEPILWSSWLDIGNVTNVYPGEVVAWVGLVIGLAPPLGGKYVYGVVDAEYLLLPVETGAGPAVLVATRRGGIFTSEIYVIGDVESAEGYVPIVVYAEPGSTVTLSIGGVSREVWIPATGVATVYVEQGVDLEISTAYGERAVLSADEARVVRLTAGEAPEEGVGDEQQSSGEEAETGGGTGGDADEEAPPEESGEEVSEQPVGPEKPTEEPQGEEAGEPSDGGGTPLIFIAIAVVVLAAGLALLLRRR